MGRGVLLGAGEGEGEGVGADPVNPHADAKMSETPIVPLIAAAAANFKKRSLREWVLAEESSVLCNDAFFWPYLRCREASLKSDCQGSC